MAGDEKPEPWDATKNIGKKQTKKEQSLFIFQMIGFF